MPLYDFLCRECEARFEDLVSLDAVDDQACPECGSAQVVKLYSPFRVGASARVGAGVDATGGACLPGPAGGGGRSGGCCGGGCGAC